MDFAELIESHIERRRRHHDRRAAGDGRRRDGDGHLPVRRPRPDRRLRGEAERRAPRRDRQQHPAGRRPPAAHTPDKPFVASMGIYVFSRDVLLEVLDAAGRSTSAARSSRRRSATHRVQPVPVPRLLGRRRHHRVVLRRQHHADAARRAVQLLRSARPIYTHPRFLPASRVVRLPRRRHRSSPKAATSIAATIDELGRRHPHAASARARRSRGRCCSAPTSTRRTTAARRDPARHRPRRRARPRDRRQERAHRRRRRGW